MILSNSKVCFRKRCLAILTCTLLLFPVFSSAEEMASFDDFALVHDVNQNLDLIRTELGMPKAGRSPSYVVDASPREVIYQAATLCEKSSHLRFEWTRTQGSCPPLKTGIIQVADVLQHVHAAMKNIQVIKRRFNIKKSPETSLIDKTKTPTDVFMAIVAANRQLNVLLRKQYLPDDVFRKMTQAIYYTAKLLSHFPAVEQRIPTTPVLKRKKTPTDVYVRLEEGFFLIRQISKISGNTILDLNVNQYALSHVTPSDVYDVTSVIVSELAYLHWQAGGKNIIESYQPPPKTPAQVFQRAGILILQLKLLLEQVKKKPNGLRRKH